MEYDYKVCRLFVKHTLKLNLYPYQEEMLKAFCQGKEVRSARGAGRSYVAKAFGEYVASLCDRNDYNKIPDVVIPYSYPMEAGLIDKRFIEREKAALSEEAFKREYLCE